MTEGVSEGPKTTGGGLSDRLLAGGIMQLEKTGPLSPVDWEQMSRRFSIGRYLQEILVSLGLLIDTASTRGKIRSARAARKLSNAVRVAKAYGGIIDEEFVGSTVRSGPQEMPVPGWITTSST